MASSVTSAAAPSQPFDYFLVLDFEATCDRVEKVSPQEIIEFPVLKLNSRTLETEAVFHQYVRPDVNPRLTQFCTELTGITQDMVSEKGSLQDVLKDFHLWMKTNELLGTDKTFCFVTCGDWDLKTMLPGQCRYLRTPVPDYFHRWINIKVPFRKTTGFKDRASMVKMLSVLGLRLDGRHHSGIDDCKNIAKILCALIQRGADLQSTSDVWRGGARH